MLAHGRPLILISSYCSLSIALKFCTKYWKLEWDDRDNDGDNDDDDDSNNIKV